MRYKSKPKQKAIDYNFMPKKWMCTGKNEKQLVTIHKKQTTLHYPNNRNSQLLLLDKWNVAKIPNYVSFSCKRSLSFYLKVKMAEVLILSGTEDHTFGPTNVKENFPEEELTLGKNRLLEVDSLEWNRRKSHRNCLQAVCWSKSRGGLNEHEVQGKVLTARPPKRLAQMRSVSHALVSTLQKYRSNSSKPIRSGSLPALQTRSQGGGSGAIPPKLCCVQKFLFQTYDKYPLKMYFAPSNLKNLATGLLHFRDN